jgi:hypothetical protein
VSEHSGKARETNCTDCGARSAWVAKGRCRPCYDKARCARRICTDCGQLRRHHGFGRCARCFRRHKLERPETCSECLAWGPVVGGRCSGCRQFGADNTSGPCETCGRELPLGADRQCRLCLITRRGAGSAGWCPDCGLWAALKCGRCNSCAVFRFRCKAGVCILCGRHVVVGKLGRCRRCLVTGARVGVRYPGRRIDPSHLDPDHAPLPGREAIQLFFAGMREAGSWASQAAATVVDGGAATASDPAFIPGQLRLVWLAADLSRVPIERALQAGLLERPDLISAVTAFGEARGWSHVVVRNVQRTVAMLLMARNEEHAFDPKALRDLASLDLPVTPTLDLMKELGWGGASDRDPMDLWLEERLRLLPAQLLGELTSWTDVLRGRSKRRRKPQLPNTVKAYVRVCVPALLEWSARYGSLRQVTSEDIEGQLVDLVGWERPNALAGMRSLFRTLKANRVVFVDPTVGVRVQSPSRRPPVGIDSPVRASLLDGIDRPDRRLIMLLAGVHALSKKQIAGLRLDQVDLAGNRLLVHGQPRSLDALTRAHLISWLEFRRCRWPRTANPHLLVSSQSANRLAPVGLTFLHDAFRGLPVNASELRIDRLVAEALDSGGDALRIALLFGMSAEAATGYAAAFSPFDEAPPTKLPPTSSR